MPVTIHRIDRTGTRCERCGADLREGGSAPWPSGKYLRDRRESDSRVQFARDFDARAGETPCR